MGHGKETPRQKMIGMMYLVLTALLALNVSKDILEAFVRVNKGLEITNSSFSAQNERLMTKFETEFAKNQTKVGPYLEAAKRAKDYADLMYDSIYSLKKDLVALVEQHDLKTEEGKQLVEEKVANVALIQKKDDYDNPTRIMVGDGSNPEVGRAHTLKLELDKFRENLLDIVRDEKLPIMNRPAVLQNLSDLGINTKDPAEDELSEDEKKDPAARFWETRNYYHNVVVATITILTNLQNDVRNAESQILNTLLSQIDASDFKFDKITAKCVPKSSYVLQGDKYEADLFVAAYSTTEDPIVIIGAAYDTVTGELTGDTTMVPVEAGVGKYTVAASGSGLKKFAALIKVKRPDGSYASYAVPDMEYTVAPPSAVVSPTKMNVLYRGIANPISVSAAGMSSDALSAGINNGKMTSKGGGNYEVWPGSSNTAVISVSATLEGKSRSMGSQEFRVKDIPDPAPQIGPKKKAVMKKSELTSAGGIDAELGNFAFDLKFSVVSFKVAYKTASGYWDEVTVGGSRFNGKVNDAIRSIKPGQRISFEEIKAKGPDGKTREIGSISIKIIP